MGQNRKHLQKSAASLKRKKGKREPLPRILIVTEGSKTEPIYFNDIRRQNRVSSVHINVTNADGTAPIQIVNYAEQLFSRSKAYEAVYVVFDRDEHPTYNQALARARALNNTLKNDEGVKIPFVAIPSVPCFEIWLILHFQDVGAFYHRTDLFRMLRRHIPAYAKGAEGMYAATIANLAQATARAVVLRRNFTADTGVDPYTNVDELVAELMKIKSRFAA